MNELIEALKVTARKKSSMDDFDAESGDTPNYYCGNFDDCYGMGYEDGQISQARALLNKLGINYKEETKV